MKRPAGGPGPVIARPTDRDLTWDLHGVIIDVPVVYERELWLGYTTSGGRRAGDVIGGEAGGFTITISPRSLDDDEFAMFLGQLDEWANSDVRLRFCAGAARLAAFYVEGDDTAFLPIPVVFA